jgi:guanylate kinase
MKKAVRKIQPSSQQPVKPLLIVLSGPSGVGKDAVLVRMKESDYPLNYITTLTTRSRRPNEKDGVDYHFTSAEKFRVMMENNELLEHAHVYGNWYGIPRQSVKQALDTGQDTIVRVDVQGAATIKKLLPKAVFIFLMPPSIEDLFTRLKSRRTESEKEMALRLKTAEDEIKQLPLFDYTVVNHWNEINRAIDELKSIITAEKNRKTPREISL